jgi:DNA-binding transcriptional ArsR family regulator
MRLSESESTTAAMAPKLTVAPSTLPRRGPVHDAFDALADGHRRELLRMLCEADRSVNELASQLPISRPAVSRHLKVLMEAGLVAETHAGTRHIFRLRPEGVRAVQDYLERVWGLGAGRLQLVPVGEDIPQQPR